VRGSGQVALDDVCRHRDTVLLADDGAEGRRVLAKQGVRKDLVQRGRQPTVALVPRNG
jgi:hypothetical protein